MFLPQNRFYLEPRNRYASSAGNCPPDAVLRKVVALNIKHLLMVADRAPIADVKAGLPAVCDAHTLTFSNFARDYLRDLLSKSPETEVKRWAPARLPVAR